ncbi:DNA polymerase III subunit delta [Phycisphaera mikurensis]|uniref:DNA-directed DNA polymerase n=1 Tax=Phycisphaera mikurensis (strain NBRC 102666 / KCTC 22515 / FYK2301M01) TaxID=1142394 RepID=I0IHR9_PHYMF|nr:DNA polymerase III subunit delta [Phycisphaera mikurensis]MBB6441051.1 DNA polymerase III delta subunit [Phycisphaera mikurensis]BAM04807.1 putative DNA polymerase III delta subunit [Phycisphaera mikurensis NBRC 102666]
MARAPSSAPVSWASDTRVAVLHGPEAGLRQEHRRSLVAALEAAHGEVDVAEVDGRTAGLADVLDGLRGYSLMGGHKLVSVTSAEVFVQAHRAAMERYAEAPVDHATLLLEADAWRPGNLDKAIKKVGQVVKCEPLRGQDAQRWAVARARDKHDAKLPPQAAKLLVARTGSDLLALDAALGKLAAMAATPGGGTPEISEQRVRDHTEATSEEKAWVIQNELLMGLGRGKPEALLTTIRDLIDRSKQPEVLVMWAAADLCRKLAQAEEMKAAGAGAGEIGRALKLWGPAASAFGRASAGLSPERARGLFADALRVDGRAKRGLGNPRRLLEAFCVGVAA